MANGKRWVTHGVCLGFKGNNRRRGVAGEMKVCACVCVCECVCVRILVLFVHAGVTDGKENCGCVSVAVCV